MAEERQSMLYRLKPITDRLPAVSKPEGHVPFKSKMIWTLAVLIMYFVMTNVMIYGIATERTDVFEQFRAIMAGSSFSLMHLGIGPIVTGSIIMQLFVGAKIINLDLANEDDKAVYQGTQKLMVILMIFVEAIPQVYGYLQPSSSLEGTYGADWAKGIIIAQLFVGSYLVFLMDEVVSKWGIGSGVSLFIAAGVSQAIITGTINWMPVERDSPLTVGGSNKQANLPSGTIPKTIYILQHMSVGDFSQRGLEMVFLGEPNPIIALLGTLVIFFIVAYAESTRIELPLAHGRVRGARGRYPIRLIYASNIPVILMSALLANVNMFTLLFYTNPSLMRVPVLGHNWVIGKYVPGNTAPQTGLAYYVSQVNGVHEWLLPLLNEEQYGVYMGNHSYMQVAAHVIIYVLVMVLGSVIFAKFWIATTNMGPEDVAKQIQNSGMQIPGFRRDPRVLRRVLERYIPMVTVISGAFVGLLAASADLIGTVGSTSGTGVLLTVGIMIQLYEAIGREQLMEMHPVLRGFFGE